MSQNFAVHLVDPDIGRRADIAFALVDEYSRRDI